MEDKNRPIDQAFTDQAWKEMHQMLDEAMPVEAKPKKRLGWWWFLMGLGLLAFSTGIYFFLQQESVHPESTEKPAAIAQSKAANNNLSSISAPIEENEPPISTGEQSSNPEPASASPIVKKKNIEKVHRSLHNKPSNNTQKESTLTLSSLENDEPIQVALFPPVSKQAISEIRKPTSKVEELKLLPLLEVLELGNLAIPSVSIPFDESSIPNSRNFGLSIYASGYASPQSSGGGYGAGALLNFPINHSRFSFGVGLGYAAFIQPLDVVLFATADQSSGGADPGSSGNEELIFEDGYVTFNNSGVLSEFAVNSTRTFNWDSRDNLTMHYLTLPLELSYRQGRFRAILGAEAGLLLAYNSDFKSGGLLNFSNKSTDPSGGFLDQESSFESAQALFDTNIKNYDIATTAGIGFDVSPKIGFELRYRRGLVDLVEDNYNRNDYHRFIQATFRYRIK